MSYYQEVMGALREVYARKAYLLLSALIAALLVAFNTLASNYRVLLSNFSWKLIFFLFIGGITGMPPITVSLLIIMSIVAGVVVSLSVFLIRRQISGSVGAGSSSLLMGVLAPACTSCSMGILGMFGMGGFLAILPFKGLELGLIGIVVLLISLVHLSRKVIAKTCIIN